MIRNLRYWIIRKFFKSEGKWPKTMDAVIWAEEWENMIKKYPDIPLDKECMIGWFANAIMAGYDEAERRK